MPDVRLPVLSTGPEYVEPSSSSIVPVPSTTRTGEAVVAVVAVVALAAAVFPVETTAVDEEARDDEEEVSAEAD